MAARSDEPAKRCASPQSFSTSAAGRRRASISAKTSMAAESRAAGVMRASRRELNSFHRPFQRGAPARSRRLVSADMCSRLKQVAGVKALRKLAGASTGQHATQQIVIVLVAIGLQVEILRHFGEALVTDAFDVSLHESIVVVPRDAGRAYGCLLGTRGNLMGVKIVQPELVDQRLLNLLMQDEVAIGVDRAPVEFEGLRHMTVDIDRLAVQAVAREIGNVVLAVELLYAPTNRIERAVHHDIRDVPLRQFEFLVRGRGMAKIERHGVDPQSMIPNKPAPDLIRGGNRFSEKIIFKRRI